MVVLCSFALGVVPFALTDTVNGAIIAGLFSVVNTILNLRLIRFAKQQNAIAATTAEQLNVVRDTAKEANEEMIQHRTEQEKKNGES